MADSRSKGKRGETAAKRLLQERDFIILADLSAGIASCDLLARDERGTLWAVEVKNREIIHPQEFRAQARKNARSGTRWMVLAKYAGTSSWVVDRQGMRPCVWHERRSK